MFVRCSPWTQYLFVHVHGPPIVPSFPAYFLVVYTTTLTLQHGFAVDCHRGYFNFGFSCCTYRVTSKLDFICFSLLAFSKCDVRCVSFYIVSNLDGIGFSLYVISNLHCHIEGCNLASGIFDFGNLCFNIEISAWGTTSGSQNMKL